MHIGLDVLIEDLEKKVFLMIDLTSQIINNAMNYYMEHKDSFYQSVNHLEETINEYENKIDENAIRIFALEQPFAFDLRKIMMIIKMNIDLERIGDLAYNIAQRTKSNVKAGFFNVAPKDICHQTLVFNFKYVNDMLHKLKKSYMEKEIETFKTIIDMDKIIDEHNSQIFKESLNAVTDNPQHIRFYMNQITISKSLERMGDHCTNIAQDLIYVFTGINIKHRYMVEDSE